MDRIYKAATKDFTAFNNVPALQGVSYEDFAEFENFGGLSIAYKEEYLKENIKVKLFFPKEGVSVKVRVNVRISKTVLLNFYMSYDFKKRIMTYEPIEIAERLEGRDLSTHYENAENINKYLSECNVSREDIAEYQRYALYDIVIKTWVEANGGDYETEKEKMEGCSLTDNTFAFASE